MEQALEAFKERDNIEQMVSNNDTELQTKLLEISREEEEKMTELKVLVEQSVIITNPIVQAQDLTPDEFERKTKALNERLERKRNSLENKWKKQNSRIEKKTEEVHNINRNC